MDLQAKLSVWIWDGTREDHDSSPCAARAARGIGLDGRHRRHIMVLRFANVTVVTPVTVAFDTRGRAHFSVFGCFGHISSKKRT